MLPGIVLVIGIMLFWNGIYRLIPLYNTIGIMVLAYVALYLPYTVQYVTSAFTQISDSRMLPDGTYSRKHSAAPFDSQAFFMEESPHVPAAPRPEHTGLWKKIGKRFRDIRRREKVL